MAVVIGATVRRASPDDAAAAIAGFAVLNDVTMRDWQYRTPQWLQGKTFERSTRYTLDLGSVAVLKEETHLPVIVDPSHAAGRRALVLPLARAAVAVGADGIIVEAHPRPEEALCDGPQQIPVVEFAEFAREVTEIVALMGKQIG